MTVSVVARFLIGDPNAIKAVAGSRAALWTGLILVLLTAVARNYDQTFILENPFLWIFGPLIFSIFSGTWVFLLGYGIAWGYMGAERRPLWNGWPAFMGLFWMTAPVAWLYAIPVERLFDSITAAKANVLLLLIVSTWRVLLMSRVFQVLHRAPFLMALAWILIPTTVEVLALSVFGSGLEKRIMAAMMGMRNSPEEEILLHAMSVASSTALCLLPVAIVVTVAWRMKVPTDLLPTRNPGKIPTFAIGIMAAFWFAAAIIPQRELSRNARLEKMLAKEEFRAALGYLSAHRPKEFAPARALPPEPFERELFEQLPPLLAAAKSSDAPWVHEHLLLRWTQMYDHICRGWYVTATNTPSREERIKRMNHNIQWAQHFAPLGGAEFDSILKSLERIPGGTDWLSTNDLFLAGLAKYATDPPIGHGRSTRSEDAQQADWNSLLAHLTKLGITNSVGEATSKEE